MPGKTQIRPTSGKTLIEPTSGRRIIYDPEQSSVDLNVSKQLDNISEKKKIRNTQIQAQ